MSVNGTVSYGKIAEMLSNGTGTCISFEKKTLENIGPTIFLLRNKV